MTDIESPCSRGLVLVYQLKGDAQCEKIKSVLDQIFNILPQHLFLPVLTAFCNEYRSSKGEFVAWLEKRLGLKHDEAKSSEKSSEESDEEEVIKKAWTVGRGSVPPGWQVVHVTHPSHCMRMCVCTCSDRCHRGLQLGAPWEDSHPACVGCPRLLREDAKTVCRLFCSQ